MTTEWFAGTISEMDQEGSRKMIHAGETVIGIFRRRGKYIAYKNVCPHQGGPVCEGVLIGKVEAILTEDKRVLGEIFSEEEMHLVCPWHGYEYNLETGDGIGDRRLKLKSYEVIERGDDLYVIL